MLTIGGAILLAGTLVILDVLPMLYDALEGVRGD